MKKKKKQKEIKRIVFFEVESFFKSGFSGASSKLAEEIKKIWVENKEKILKEFFDDSDYFDIPKNFYFLKIKHPIVTDDNGANVDIIGFSFQDSECYEDINELIQEERFSSFSKSNLIYLEYDKNFAKQIANTLIIYNQIPLLEGCDFLSTIVFSVKEIEFCPSKKIITIKGKIAETWFCKIPWNCPKEINTIRMHLEERFSELQEEISLISWPIPPLS